MSPPTEARPGPFNWQLVLLGLTALALSVASGWTTWDGMANFTDSRWLSFLITFGIQGVMLVTAWLIGETFVNELPERDRKAPLGRFMRAASTVMSGLAVLLMVVAALALFHLLPRLSGSLVGDGFPATPLILVAIALLIASTFITSRDIQNAYSTHARTILRNLPLWFMFLLCMGASIFFSFDSLFTRIFPPAERSRAGEIRAQRDLSVILTEAAHRVDERKTKAVRDLFTGEAWKNYDSTTQRLLEAANIAPDKLRDLHSEGIARATNAISQTRSELARLEAQKDRLERQKRDLTGNVSDLRAELARIDKEADQLKALLQEKISASQDIKASMEAELRGVGRTKAPGRGPVYRELQQRQIQVEIAINEARQRQAQQAARREEIAARLAAKEKAEVEIAGELAGLTSRIEVSAAKVNKTLSVGDSHLSEDIEAIRTSAAQLAEARASFQRNASTDALVMLKQACAASRLSISSALPQLLPEQPKIDCEIGRLQGPLGVVMQSREAADVFAANCGKSVKLSGSSTSELLSLGRQCLQLAALDATETAELGSQINRIALRRDDTAHRFVVTTNAFLDGNQLAYLALAIAFAIDALVFVSGLVGAAAAAPATRGATTHQGLIPNTRHSDPAQVQVLMMTTSDASNRDAAEFLLGEAQPIDSDLGYTHALSGERTRPKAVAAALNAGIAAGTVKWDAGPEPRYLITPAFFIAIANAVKPPSPSAARLEEHRAEPSEEKARRLVG